MSFRAAVVLAALVLSAGHGARAQAQAAALAASRAEADFPARLERAFGASDTVDVAIGVLAENLAYVKDTAKRRELALTLAGLYELRGRFSEAADRYEEAAYARPEYRDTRSLLAACAARIAAGEAEKAEGMLKALALTAEDPAVAVKARVLSAWCALSEGRSTEARSIAAEAVSLAAASPELRLEALVVAWASADGPAREAHAAAIKAAYATTPEAALVAGGAPPPLAHWLLSGVYGREPGGDAAGTQAPAAKPALDAKPADAAQGAAGPKGDQPAAFQIGAFTVEKNAVLLRDRLVAAGFKASVEKKEKASTWIVLVETGTDPQSTLMKLKDAGFEAFAVY